MKVGDLVKDRDNGVYGIIIEEDRPEGMFHVMWNFRTREWLTEYYLEIVSESPR